MFSDIVIVPPSPIHFLILGEYPNFCLGTIYPPANPGDVRKANPIPSLRKDHGLSQGSSAKSQLQWTVIAGGRMWLNSGVRLEKDFWWGVWGKQFSSLPLTSVIWRCEAGKHRSHFVAMRWNPGWGLSHHIEEDRTYRSPWKRNRSPD